VGLMMGSIVDTAHPNASITPPRAEDARPAPRRPLSPGVEVSDARTEPGFSSTVTPATAVSPPDAVDMPRVDSSFQSQASRQAAPLVSRLPTPSEELSPDGLPVSGLRCTHDGGSFNCGSCRTDGDCPEGQGCVANRQTRRFECMSSECEEDTHCFPGFVCHRVNTGTTGAAIIRRCVPEGLRHEGEHCDTLPISPAGSCREGLVCLGGICSVPCRVDDPSSCPTGYSCEDSPHGAGCYPDCRELGCPEGQRCKLFSDGDAQCLASVRGDCPESPCGEGERCNMRVFRGHGVFWCARPCNPLRADSCPAGQVCGMGSATVSTCYRKCDPTDPDSCGEGWSCASVSEDMRQWGCRPTVGK
jgi:hypothetical protein